jgi:hypothetical protein
MRIVADLALYEPQTHNRQSVVLESHAFAMVHGAAKVWSY